MTVRGTAKLAGTLAGVAIACSSGSAAQRGTSGAETSPAVAGTPTSPGGGTSAGAAAANQPKQPPAQELPEVAGRLTAVNRNELRVEQQGGEEVKLKIDPATTAIDVDGRQATLNDLAPGTEVRASYEESKGDKHALTVHAKTGQAPQAK
jgi:hypothetical protein